MAEITQNGSAVSFQGPKGPTGIFLTNCRECNSRIILYRSATTSRWVPCEIVNDRIVFHGPHRDFASTQPDRI